MLEAVEQHIKERTSLAFDIAYEKGQIFDNVKHMQWYQEELADAILDNDPQLADEIYQDLVESYL